MAASFEQVVRNRNQNEGFGCVVILMKLLITWMNKEFKK